MYLKKAGGFHQIFASDGDFFDECIGYYNINDGTPIKFDNEKLSHWLRMGAIPTLEVINIISHYYTL
ncbi:MAG: 30S ribosomal protein S16 [Gammaproteobacteria bacterium]|nr:30S ribosomal protein S16 [Gammaproteobacteria bacterium]